MNNSLQQHSRRQFMTRCITRTAGVLALPFASHVQAIHTPVIDSKIQLNQARELAFHHTHTGQNLSVVYHDGESYLSSQLEEINQFLGDFRTKETYPIDSNLLDALYLLQQKMGVENTFEVISGYRSPKTNAKLRNKSNGVAKRSLHMQGKAIDIRLVGVNTKQLRDTAIAMKIGGVGYYRRSDFIHLDTGRVRFW
ncbi:MAG: DUF882 domain-containing protein [Gammaproteobacteria bacterium]|nr:DUF882 domain-containing protein [Gammaproteobacteria bacterium]